LRSSSGRAEAAVQDLETALEIAGARRDEASEAWACTHLSYAAYLLGDAERTLSFAERSESVAARLADPKLRASSQNALGIAWGSRGLYRRAIEHYRRAAELAESIGDEASLGRHLGNLAINLRLLGELDEAKKLGTRALDIARRQGQIARECNALVNLGLVELDRGDLDAATWAFQTGLEIAMSIDLRFALPEAHAGLAEVARRQGNLSLAEEHGTRGLAVAEEERHAPMVGGLLRILAAVASERARSEGGSQNAATDLYERSVAVLRTTGATDELARSLEALGGHLAGLGRPEASRATLDEAAAVYESLGIAERAAAIRRQGE
jgi:tetratricopeptide (TPR) repeat protein